jgi:hypothetical protein
VLAWLMRSYSLWCGTHGCCVQMIFNWLNKGRDPNKYIHISGSSLINAICFCVSQVTCMYSGFRRFFNDETKEYVYISEAN